MSANNGQALQENFRNVMARVCTPVSVVTAIVADKPYGTTVSAFASLSLDPPMVLVSLDRRSELLVAIRKTLRFGVNVLGSAQSRLARNFARKGGPRKFDDVPWALDLDVPRLPGMGGFLACRLARLIEAGDHLIVLGDVLAAESAAGLPLTYHARAFGTHVALAEANA
ncbi:flavin reductase family protein [Goodfellowiella coeruleoviolacea]|uniref:NADH-FMN oxidoreductase RutF, flavin reductase (DIM6/NTAB) family n=1 Tax=Goodfellowiella coeruleoviolacea TaxID=334858 RepID=A0AAE3KE09_9PSEU|nr:flavin reductase family protein [Goodfellowiella coeruleoviolacea]MCP2163310.1 NADH-FMN oxidoreductase RutF, flavin reductase (DIM6/NTAB) family [Goodfellowiella coeruleoviolacea]